MRRKFNRFGKCKVGGEDNRKLDRRGICSMCAFKLDSADQRAADIRGIHDDMEEAGIPVNRKYKRYESEDLT